MLGEVWRETEDGLHDLAERAFAGHGVRSHKSTCELSDFRQVLSFPFSEKTGCNEIGSLERQDSLVVQVMLSVTYLSEPRFPHLKSGDSSKTNLMGSR